MKGQQDGAQNERDENGAQNENGDGLAVGRATSEALDLSPLQFDFDVDVGGGQELFRCKYVQMPLDRVTAIASAESHYTRGSHHLLAYRTTLREIPAGQEEAFDCHEGEMTLTTRGSYYEAQQPDEKREMPEGIAHLFEPGEVMLVQAHYINYVEEPLAAHVTFILHQTDPAAVKEEAGTIYFNNVRVQLPAHSKSKTTMSCPLTQDIHLGSLWSHMHKRGVRFTATTDDPEAAEALGTLYESNEWAEPQARNYPSDVVLHAGSTISYSCYYENDSDIPYRFGESAQDNEMCILHGMYYPRMAGLGELCLTGFRSAVNEVEGGEQATDGEQAPAPAEGDEAPEDEEQAAG